MRLYPKQINSLEELRLEKQKLLDESRQTDIKKILSFDNINFTKGPTSETRDHDNSSLLTGILKDSSLQETIVSLGMPLLQKAGVKVGSAGKELGKKIIVSSAKEVLGGYLKWKAAELTIKGLSHLVKSRKKNKHAKS